MKMTPQLLALITLGAASSNVISACADDVEGEPTAQRDAVEVREDAGARAQADAKVAPDAQQVGEQPDAPTPGDDYPFEDGCPACGLG